MSTIEQTAPLPLPSTMFPSCSSPGGAARRALMARRSSAEPSNRLRRGSCSADRGPPAWSNGLWECNEEVDDDSDDDSNDDGKNGGGGGKQPALVAAVRAYAFKGGATGRRASAGYALACLPPLPSTTARRTLSTAQQPSPVQLARFADERTALLGAHHHQHSGGGGGGKHRRYSTALCSMQQQHHAHHRHPHLGQLPELAPTYWDSLERWWLPAPVEWARRSLRRRLQLFRRQLDVVGGVVQRHTLPSSTENEEEKYNGSVRFESDVEDGRGGAAATAAAGKQSESSCSAVRVIDRRKSGYGITISSDSTAKMRCRIRKQLFILRNKVCDFALFLAIVGILLVIVDSELTAVNNAQFGISKSHIVSIGIRVACLLSTLLLVASICYYHAIEVKMALIDSGADDWRVAVTTERMMKLAIEVAVCSICPLPGTGFMSWPFITPGDRTVKMVQVPVDVMLSVPMFLRAYLLCRFMVLHSKQFQDAATRSIAALNRISMDFRFVVKTMMAEHPLRVLVVFTISFWVSMSWMFTQCERYDGQLASEHYYLNSLWFIIVTFLSIGYGDVVPSTYCGRTLAISTGVVGAGVSSALIAVISRKLELSRAEKHVNNFMADSKLTNARKNAAASVLQETWFIHKYKQGTSKADEMRLRHHQRRFLSSITQFRQVKWNQRKLQEKGNSLLDVGKLHSDMHETLWEMHRTQDHFITQVELLTQKIVELQKQLLYQRPSTPLSQLSQQNAVRLAGSTPLIRMEEASPGDSQPTLVSNLLQQQQPSHFCATPTTPLAPIQPMSVAGRTGKRGTRCRKGHNGMRCSSSALTLTLPTSSSMSGGAMVASSTSADGVPAGGEDYRHQQTAATHDWAAGHVDPSPSSASWHWNRSGRGGSGGGGAAVPTHQHHRHAYQKKDAYHQQHQQQHHHHGGSSTVNTPLMRSYDSDNSNNI